MEKSSSKSSKSSRKRGETLVELATLGRAHGIRGAVTLIIDASVADCLCPGLRVHLDGPTCSSDHQIVSVSTPGKRIVVHLSDVEDRTAAEALTGARLLVRREVLPSLGRDEYYDFELLGATVATPAGEILGSVVEIFPTGANDVYVVRGADPGEILVPAVSGAVLEVDRAAKRIIVEPTALEYSDRDD